MSEVDFCGRSGSSSRRDFLRRAGLGIGSLGLFALLQEAGMIHAADTALALDSLAPHKPHFAAKAKHVIHIFPEGGPSPIDAFDPKPALETYHGRLAEEVIKDHQKEAGETAAGMGRLSGKLQRSAFKFAKARP
ncbi:MAG: DUF1501 domain-containing protein [Planctomycetia bacterium]|nr:DUF1501 domain-containing protein [Planctomycetia bacterium]